MSLEAQPCGLGPQRVILLFVRAYLYQHKPSPQWIAAVARWRQHLVHMPVLFCTLLAIS